MRLRSDLQMERKLRGVDIVGLFFSSLCVFESLAGLMVQSSYRKLLEDFGSSLPLITRIMLNPLTLLVTGVVPMALMAEGVLRQRAEGEQVARGVVGMIVAVGLVVGFLIALYLPMFTLAGQIN